MDRKIFPVSLEGIERISAIFEYLVTVRVKDGFLWEKMGNDDKDRITRLVEDGWAGVRFQKKQRQGQTQEHSRQISGRVHDLTVEPDGEGFELVTFKIRPELAKLGRLKRTRSIQDSAKWPEAVIDKLLKDAGISSFKPILSGYYGANQEYDFRLQYRESDLEFLLRECALHGV
ncbi:MAG: contractile injection system protein, VgrG/Pvc8 family, partial [Gemmataceae bacterium]